MFTQIIVRKFEHKLHDLCLLLFSFAHLAREQQNRCTVISYNDEISRSSKSRNFILWNYLVSLTASRLWFFLKILFWIEFAFISFVQFLTVRSLCTAMYGICSTSVFRKILSISHKRACSQLLSLPLFLSIAFFWLEFDVEQMPTIRIYIQYRFMNLRFNMRLFIDL